MSTGILRAAALGAALVFVLLLARPNLLAAWGPALVATAGVVMLLTGQQAAMLWIWIVPVALGGCLGRKGLIINVVGLAAAGAFLVWQLPLPVAAIAGLALVIIWLQGRERQYERTPLTSSANVHWLLPHKSLSADVQHERRRGERESLYGEVVVFGCARSTAEDMKQLCERLGDYLVLHERAYRLNDYGVAVILVAADVDAAVTRRKQLQHAVTPHRVVSVTPINDANSPFDPYALTQQTSTHEATTWQ